MDIRKEGRAFLQYREEINLYLKENLGKTIGLKHQINVEIPNIKHPTKASQKNGGSSEPFIELTVHILSPTEDLDAHYLDFLASLMTEKFGFTETCVRNKGLYSWWTGKKSLLEDPFELECVEMMRKL